MRNGRVDESGKFQSGKKEDVQSSGGSVQPFGSGDGLAGTMRNAPDGAEESNPIPSRLPHSISQGRNRKRDILASIEADARRGPEFDPEAGERWPVLQECLGCVLTTKGEKRAGGEVKTLATGANYRTTLVMPEEGVQVSVVHNALSKAWDALEHVLCLEPVPWVECSEFAVKRAKMRGKKKEEKKLE